MAGSESRSADEARWSAWMVSAQSGDVEAYGQLLGELFEVLRAYLRRFQLSRISFRELASHGMIPGVTKSSW